MVPTTLTSLNMLFTVPNKQEVRIEAKHFPPNLTRCIIGNTRFGALCSISGALPASITLFGQGNHVSFHYYRSSVEQFPSSLTQLTFRISSVPPPYAHPWPLPCQLIALGLHEWRVEWLEAMPRQLTSLSISSLIGVPEALDVAPLDLFEHLPTSLTYLSLEVEVTCCLKTKFSLLSPSITSLTRLRELECDEDLSFPSSVYFDLPLSLRHLFMSFPDSDFPNRSWSWIRHQRRTRTGIPPRVPDYEEALAI